jgi:hypothetical protein
MIRHPGTRSLGIARTALTGFITLGAALATSMVALASGQACYRAGPNDICCYPTTTHCRIGDTVWDCTDTTTGWVQVTTVVVAAPISPGRTTSALP